MQTRCVCKWHSVSSSFYSKDTSVFLSQREHEIYQVASNNFFHEKSRNEMENSQVINQKFNCIKIRKIQGQTLQTVQILETSSQSR